MINRRQFVSLIAMETMLAGQDILELTPPKYDERVQYGPDSLQFGDIRKPAGRGPHPVVLYIHGGFWKAAYNLDHAGHACAALTKAGALTWNIEYRRIGDAGGGWPGTLEDVERAAVYLKANFAKKYDADLENVVVAGHSAGGQLAVWLAAQQAIALRGAVALAGVVDLKRAWELHLSSGIVEKFMGGTPAEVPERYAKADPMERLPIAVKQRLVHGTADAVVPFEISERFARKSHGAQLIPLEGAGHFELIDPRTPEWKTVERAILKWS